jgi:hypothetical protein
MGRIRLRPSSWPACTVHVAHNCSDSGPRLSGLAAHDRAVCLGATRARWCGMHARWWRARSAVRRLHQCWRVAGYALGATVLDSDREVAVTAVLTDAVSDGVEARPG